MFSNFGLLAKRSMAGIAWVYILFALLSFVLVTLPQTLINGLKIQALTSGDPFVSVGIVTLLGYGFSFLALVLGIVIGTLQAGLARAARVALVDGTPALGGFGGVLKLSYARFWQVLGCLLLYALGIVIGAVFCLLPGLAVAYVGMAGVYLCASRDEGPWDALMHSFRLTTKYIGPCIVLILAALIVVGVVLGINVGLMAGLTALLGVWGTFASTLIVTLLAIPVGLIMWLLGMATFVAIETAESQVAISK
jgi:hypothetical protein